MPVLEQELVRIDKEIKQEKKQPAPSPTEIFTKMRGAFKKAKATPGKTD